MRHPPYIESVHAHNGSDWPTIAAWLLDRLDFDYPPVGNYLTLYICYDPRDGSYFTSFRRDQELSASLLDAYAAELKACQQEASWSGQGFGNLRFELSRASRPAHLALRPLSNPLEETQTESYGTLSATERRASSSLVLIEFGWQQVKNQIVPGTLGLVRHWSKPLPPETQLTAFLSVVSGAILAPHIDYWQGYVRWQQPVIYLPQGKTELLVGSRVGCDINSDAVQPPITITYESEKDEWSWGAPGADWMPRGRQRGEFIFEYAHHWKGTQVKLRGMRLPSPRTLQEQERENRLPSYKLEIVGCLLPLPRPRGYGFVPDGLPGTLASRACSALQLPGGDWLYIDDPEQTYPYLLHRGDSPPGRLLDENVGGRLSIPAGLGEARRVTWQRHSGRLGEMFCGELSFFPPISVQLASGAIAEDLPHEFFSDYKDNMLGSRAPVRLESLDGRHYALIFNEHAQYPVVLIPRGATSEQSFYPQTEMAIDLGFGADFIIGATHYRLQPIQSSNESRTSATPFLISTGGAS